MNRAFRRRAYRLKCKPEELAVLVQTGALQSKQRRASDHVRAALATMRKPRKQTETEKTA